MIKKIVHAATEPFVDKGPFGGGPAYGSGNERIVARALYDLNRKTWTPPAELLSGKTGETVQMIGAFYPVLRVGNGAALGPDDAYHCERLVQAAERAQKIPGSRNEAVKNAVCEVFGDARDAGFDRDTFLHHLRDPQLTDIGERVHDRLRAVNAVAKSEAGNTYLTHEDWEAVIESPVEFWGMGRDAFMARMPSRNPTPLQM